jgi:nitroreductase
MDVFEAMGTARAMRFFQTDPVPDELVDKVLWAATRASSGNNTQGWDFVVVRDAGQRARLGEALSGFVKRVEAMPDPGNETDRRTLVGAKNLAATFAQVPVIIVVCGANIYPPDQPRETFMYSAVFAAAQNLVVAARALGLGAAFTTLHGVAEQQFREILQIPADRYLGVTIPLGWPAGPVGPVSRKPIEEVVHHDRW